jgi:hypothetical protein
MEEVWKLSDHLLSGLGFPFKIEPPKCRYPPWRWGEGFAAGEDVMARSHEPSNGSDHVQNGVKARRAAIVLFILATFGIMVILSISLSRTIRLPIRLPRPLQAALTPAERLIRPIVPWLGPLTGSPAGPEPGQVIAGRPPISQPPPPGAGLLPQPGPPSEEPPPPPPGGPDVRKERTTLPPGTVAGMVRKPPPPTLPSSGTTSPAAGESTGTRGHSDEHIAKAGKRAERAKHGKQKKHAKHRKRGRHAKRAKHSTSAKQGNGRKKG